MAIHIIDASVSHAGITEGAETQEFSTLSGGGGGQQGGGTFMVGNNEFAGWYDLYGVWGIIYRFRIV